MATNEQILEKIETVLVPQINRNTNDIAKISPLVGNHQLVLYGDPDDRKDEGIIGAFNAMEDLFTTLKGWGVWIGRLGAGAIITFMGNQIYQMWLAYLATK